MMLPKNRSSIKLLPEIGLYIPVRPAGGDFGCPFFVLFYFGYIYFILVSMSASQLGKQKSTKEENIGTMDL